MSRRTRQWHLLAAPLLVASACVAPTTVPAPALTHGELPIASSRPTASPAPTTQRGAQDTQTEPAPPAQQPAPDVAARFFTSPSELRDELAVHKIAPRLYAGAELEGQAGLEKRGGATSNDVHLDSVTGALRWVPMYGLNCSLAVSYDLHGADGFSFEEATIKLGAVPTEPWYVAIGQTDLPFGEFNSHFREDPTTQFLGETHGVQVAGGYESDTFEFTLAADASGSPFIGTIIFSPIKDLDVGVSWTSDLSESVEIRQVIDDTLALNPALPANLAKVPGAGVFMSLQKNCYSVDFEYITGLDSFAPGLLSPAGKRPWAWNFEATTRLMNPWEVGVRLEGSAGVPLSPRFQFGLESTYSFTSHAALSLEYLHGTFGAGEADRDLLTAGMLLRW